MFRRITMALAVVATLFSASVRLPASPCILFNTPSEFACKPDSCANQDCCETSLKRTGAPVQPLANGAGDHQSIPAIASRIVAPVTVLYPSKRIAFFDAVAPAHSAPSLALLCTLLI